MRKLGLSTRFSWNNREEKKKQKETKNFSFVLFIFSFPPFALLKKNLMFQSSIERYKCHKTVVRMFSSLFFFSLFLCLFFVFRIGATTSQFHYDNFPRLLRPDWERCKVCDVSIIMFCVFLFVFLKMKKISSPVDAPSRNLRNPIRWSQFTTFYFCFDFKKN